MDNATSDNCLCHPALRPQRPQQLSRQTAATGLRAEHVSNEHKQAPDLTACMPTHVMCDGCQDNVCKLLRFGIPPPPPKALLT
jgi:hypothetical protein